MNSSFGSTLLIAVLLVGCSGSDPDSKDATGGKNGSGGHSGASTGGTAGSGGSTGGGGGSSTGGSSGASGSGGSGGNACGSGGSTSTPSGAVYYVATTGSDSNSCDQAKNIDTPKRNIMGDDGGIGCLKTPGETLMIREGTYEERINNYEAPGAWPSGTSWTDAFTVKAYPGENVTVRGIAIATNEDNAACPNGCDVGYWIFDGLHSINTVSGEAIWTRNPHHIRFIHMEASTASRKDQCIQGAGHFLEFIDIEVHHCGDPNMEPCGGACGASYGFYWGGDDNLFERIKLHDTTGYGFHVFSAGCDDVSKNCPDRNVIRYSEIYNTGTKQGSSGILFAYGDGNQAYGNVVRSNSSGIAVGYGASNTSIFNNTVFGNLASGISAGTWGAKATAGTLVKNNIVAKNGAYAIEFGAQGTIDEPTGTVLEHNLFFENSAGDVIDTGVGSVTSDNTSSDPGFVDTAGFDFHLAPSSPAIDIGAALGAPWNVDKDGVCRPMGAGYDLGAYER